ncbi:AMP-binding protein [Pseudomonas aeruginosa]
MVHGEIELSYRELNRRANVLAHRLRAEGVGPDVPVGIAMQRSPELVVALLAVLKAGGAYVPMDPGYPAERLAFLAEDSGIGLLLTQTFLQDELPFNAQLTNLCLDDPSLFQNVPAQWDGNPEQRACPEHLAYVIYTSGSTGRPKGVGITHGALVNHMRWMQERFQLAAHERVLQRTSSSFDASVWGVLAATDVRRSPALGACGAGYLARELVGAGRGTTDQCVANATVAVAGAAAFAGDDQLDSLRLLCCGGEALSGALLEQLGRRWNGELVNLYGPTEATIDACCFSAPVKEVGGKFPLVHRSRGCARAHPRCGGWGLSGGLPRRTADRRCRPGAWLPGTTRADRGALRSGPVRRRRADLPYRRPGAVAQRRADRLSRSPGPPGEDPGFPYRTGRDRGAPAGAGVRARSGGAGRRRCERPAVAGLRGAAGCRGTGGREARSLA